MKQLAAALLIVICLAAPRAYAAPSTATYYKYQPPQHASSEILSMGFESFASTEQLVYSLNLDISFPIVNGFFYWGIGNRMYAGYVPEAEGVVVDFPMEFYAELWPTSFLSVKGGIGLPIWTAFFEACLIDASAEQGSDYDFPLMAYQAYAFVAATITTSKFDGWKPYFTMRASYHAAYSPDDGLYFPSGFHLAAGIGAYFF